MVIAVESKIPDAFQVTDSRHGSFVGAIKTLGFDQDQTTIRRREWAGIQEAAVSKLNELDTAAGTAPKIVSLASIQSHQSIRFRL